MSKRPASRLERMVVDLGFWFNERWRLFVTLTLLAVGVIGLGMLATRDRDLPEVEEEAVVVRFGTTPGDEGDRPHVLVRTRDGAILQLDSDYRATLHCRRGSRSRIVRQGRYVFPASGGCAPSPP